MSADDSASRPVPASTTVVIIQASSAWPKLGLADLWRYRDLLLLLAWRDIKVRYKQTFFGVAWAIFQPLLMMLTFSLVFGRLAKLPSDGVEYSVFVFCALLPWQLFSYSLTQTSNSLVASNSLIKKVYFPRLVIPVATTLEGIADFCVAFVVLIAMLAYFHVSPGINVVFLPLFVLLAVVTALAVGLWFAALNVKYRDVRYTVPFITQLWMFATPVAYSSSLVPERWRWLYACNPMVGVVEGFRWALLGQRHSLGTSFFVSLTIVAILLIGGLAYFRRMERSFADLL